MRNTKWDTVTDRDHALGIPINSDKANPQSGFGPRLKEGWWRNEAPAPQRICIGFRGFIRILPEIIQIAIRGEIQPRTNIHQVMNRECQVGMVDHILEDVVEVGAEIMTNQALIKLTKKASGLDVLITVMFIWFALFPTREEVQH